MPLSGFHPAVARWFEARFREPTEPQRRAWPVIQAGRNALIAAPTGSGKTFAAFLAAIDSLLRQGLDGTLRGERTVIVDEIHAVARDKRGSHLALSLERLEHLAGRRLQRIGLSATQKPIEDIAQFLVGAHRAPAPESRAPTIIDSGHARALDLAIEIPSSPLEAVMAGVGGGAQYTQPAHLFRWSIAPLHSYMYS